jgi:hypothetical protein
MFKIFLCTQQTTITALKHLKSSAFWDITLCGPLKVSRRFGETFRLHFQD